MKSKISAYWICQIGGWLFYGMTMLFFSFVFGQNLEPYQYSRLIISLIIGVLFTHLLRWFINYFNAKPPVHKSKWGTFSIIVLLVAIFYSLLNSAIVEIAHLYNPKIKFSFFKRSLFNLVNDGPIILIWVAIYFVWHYVEMGRKSEVATARLETLVKELELKTIKSHINPHFIFNALNSIRALVDENPMRARTAITELSNILRSSMQAENIETASLERELNIVKDYLALEQIRFEERLKVAFEIDENTLDYPVPPMMLQTLVENAIKHGISKQINGGVITIKSYCNGNQRELVVQNTGTLSDNMNHEGFGIVSTQNRLQLLYGSNAVFELRDINQQIVEAKIIMPLDGI